MCLSRGSFFKLGGCGAMVPFCCSSESDPAVHPALVGPPSRLLRMYQQLRRWVYSVSRWSSLPTGGPLSRIVTMLLQADNGLVTPLRLISLTGGLWRSTCYSGNSRLQIGRCLYKVGIGSITTHWRWLC